MTQSYAARAVGRGVFSQPLLYCQHFRRMHIILCQCVEVTPRLVHAYHRWSPRCSCTVPEPKGDHSAFTLFQGFSVPKCAQCPRWPCYGATVKSTSHPVQLRTKKNYDFTNDHWLNKQLYTTSASPHEGDSVSFRAAVPGTCMSQSKVRCTTTLPARSKRTGT